MATEFNLELERERTKEEKERENILHLFRCYTHTHIYMCVYRQIDIFKQNTIYFLIMFAFNVSICKSVLLAIN